MIKRIISALIVAFFISCAGVRYKKALEENTVESYRLFLQKYPEHESYSDFARGKIDSLSYEKARKSNTIEAYENYLSSFPQGMHVPGAQKEIDKLDFRAACKTNTVKAYQSYLSKHPDGKNRKKAIAKMDSLCYQKAFSLYTEMSFMNYVDSWPKGQFTDIAFDLADSIAFATACSDSSSSALNIYIERYPQGVYRNIADERIYIWMLFESDSLPLFKNIISYKEKYPTGKELDLFEDLFYRRVINTKKLKSIQTFMQSFPGSELINELEYMAVSLKKQYDELMQYINGTKHLNFSISNGYVKLNYNKMSNLKWVNWSKALDHLPVIPWSVNSDLSELLYLVGEKVGWDSNGKFTGGKIIASRLGYKVNDGDISAAKKIYKTYLRFLSLKFDM